MENLREMPYLKVIELQVAIHALCELYYKNTAMNGVAMEIAEKLAFTENLKEHLDYCKELLESRRSLI